MSMTKSSTSNPDLPGSARETIGFARGVVLTLAHSNLTPAEITSVLSSLEKNGYLTSGRRRDLLAWVLHLRRRFLQNHASVYGKQSTERYARGRVVNAFMSRRNAQLANPD